MAFDPTSFTSAMLTELDTIKAIPRDDWNVLEMPTTLQESVDAEEDSVFAIEVGLFVSDFTDFSTYCYDLYETDNENYQHEGCPYALIKYYDGGALGIYQYTNTGTGADILNSNTDLYSQQWAIHMCPGDSSSCAYMKNYMGYNDIYDYDMAVFLQGQSSWNTKLYEVSDVEWDLMGGEALGMTSYAYAVLYPSYGFSKTTWGMVMNSNGDAYAYTGYNWPLFHLNKELMSWFKFLAVSDERLDIGDTQTWFIFSMAEEMIAHEITLTGTSASGISLTASAALLLASATLL